MNGTRLGWQAALVAVAVAGTATSGSARWLRTAVDPTCAVIEKAEYDAAHRSIRITGRSSEAVTLRVYDRETNDTVLTIERPESGKWTVEYEIVGATPGMVVVQGVSGCASFRLVSDDSYGQLPDRSADATVAALAAAAGRGPSGSRID